MCSFSFSGGSSVLNVPGQWDGPQELRWMCSKAELSLTDKLHALGMAEHRCEAI